MFLEYVWSALPEGKWESAETLRDVSGVDEDTLRRVLGFLVRWDFAETRRSPDLQVRRKMGVISPVEVVSLLRSFAGRPTRLPGRLRLAERVACRTCGGRGFIFHDRNEVECERCHERQWFAIEIGEEHSRRYFQEPYSRSLLRLKDPSLPVARKIPKSRLSWFRSSSSKWVCPKCKSEITSASDIEGAKQEHYDSTLCGLR